MDDMDARDRYSSQVASSIQASARKAEGPTTRKVDKADRATTEQVLDPRTRAILLKLVKSGLVEEINGCVSTGKEANVYHARDAAGKNYAIKVYKTSILVFKDRDRYVRDEYRFRTGYARHNPRKMVKLWAEKEMRNLKRLRGAGISAPETFALKSHVLVMSFVGDAEGWPAPRLKDAPIDDSAQWHALYLDLIRTMWVMYHKCRLVHADLSEYNILYMDGKLTVIDVSQSVEHDHPHAMEFLRKDCMNVCEFFGKRCAPILGLRTLFELVVSDMDGIAANVRKELGGELLDQLVNSFGDDPEIYRRQLFDTYLEHLLEVASRPKTEAELAEQEVSEQVFARIFIPRTLDDIVDLDKEADRLQRGETLEYGAVTGIAETAGKSDQQNGRVVEDDDSESSDGDQEDSGAEEGEDGEETSKGGTKPTGPKRLEDKEAKKERKAAAKEERREKRKHKVPKAVKKRKEKEAQRR